MLLRIAQALGAVHEAISPRLPVPPLSVEWRLAEPVCLVEDIERLKRLASVVPHPSPALLDSLRRQFAPDVPDAALLHLWQERVGLLDALVDVHLTRASDVGF